MQAGAAAPRPYLGDLAVASWNAQGLLCESLVRARRKQAFMHARVRILDIVVVQEAHCGDCAFLEMERPVQASPSC